MAFRAFFALPAESFRTSSGQYTNAVHGFFNTLLRLIDDYHPTHIAVAFDLPGGTFRTREYIEYKGGRNATPEEFKGQISVIQDVLDVIGIKWFTYEDYEADDIVATLATKGEAAGMRVYVASGDKDSYQLVNDHISVVYPMPRQAMLLMTPDVVEERSGVRPERYEDLAALVGEGADNIPGVPGVGPKTAAKWIAQFGDLNGILAHASEIKGKVGDQLRAHIDQVKLNRKINELVRDLPLGDDFSLLVPIGVDTEQMHQLFDTLEFTSLRRKVTQQLPAREGSNAQAASSGNLELRAVHAVRRAEVTFDEFIASHPAPYGIAVRGVMAPAEGSVDAFAVAGSDGYVYTAQFAELNPSDESSFAQWLGDAEQAKIGHNVKGMRHAFAAMGCELGAVVADSEIEAYLLHPDQKQYVLSELANRFLGIDVSGDGTGGATLGIGVDGALVSDSLGPQAVATLDLHDYFTAQLSHQPHVDALLAMELQVGEALFDMERRGIAVDTDALGELHTRFSQRVDDAASRALEAAGEADLNLSSPKQLQRILFDELHLPKTKKTKSGYTTNADALAQLLETLQLRGEDDHSRGVEFLSALLEHRDAIKLRQSVEGLQKAVQADRRIHTTYQQTVAATGRLSSTEPNLQNIHARTEEGLQIREVFVPGAGFDYLMTADYSQIEMRLMAHLSKDAALIEAFNSGEDLHRYVASQVFGIAPQDVTGAQRSKIKAMSYGLVYGLSAYGLSAQLKISVTEAQQLMDGYFARFGHVKEYLDSLVERARRDGYTETIMGRRRYLPDLVSTNRQRRQAAERMALNAPIQGSAADVIKRAMLNVDRGLAEAGLESRILLQVHDELVLEVRADEAEQVESIVRREMGNAWELSVPLEVGVGIGRNWRDAAH
ncbi:MAG: DNA polymerase I [Arcanobacterium sp.]|nr:DNA polymerase I [Arcanobacterium sp.]